MNVLTLHDFHRGLGARFGELSGHEIVESYGDALKEHQALYETAGVLDLSFRSRTCLLGNDRQRFLNGQVTNNVAALKTGEGCYAALISAKGKMLSDLYVYALENEILLDFEPGLTTSVSERLDKYIIADDVQIVDVAPHYGLLSVQGPRSKEILERMALGVSVLEKALTFVKVQDPSLGEIYIVNQPRCSTAGFDLFVPIGSLQTVADQLIGGGKSIGGMPCGWQALEIARIEAGIPRFGVDMDETNLPPEAGLENRAISYSKGCYIGQEVIARIRTYGQVAKALRGIRLADQANRLPQKGDKIYLGQKEVGYITSSAMSPLVQAKIAMGYVRRECNQVDTELVVESGPEKIMAKIVALPFYQKERSKI